MGKLAHPLLTVIGHNSMIESKIDYQYAWDTFSLFHSLQLLTSAIKTLKNAEIYTHWHTGACLEKESAVRFKNVFETRKIKVK